MQGLSIIIPTLNEVENIDNLLSRIFSSLARSGLNDSEVIIIDDGSNDGTQDKVKAWQVKHPVKLIVRAGKKGLASAVIEGARSADYSCVLVMDADLSHPPEKIPELAAPLLADRQDMVIGSRYIKGGGTPGWPISRKITSRVATIFTWPFLEVKDPMAGFFCTKKKLLADLPVETSGFKIGFELLMRHHDSLRVSEVPIVFHDRVNGQSKLSGPVIKEFLSQLLKLAGGNISLASGSKFAFVGLLGVVIDLAIFNILTILGAPLGYAHSISFTVAAISNFLLNANWTFSDTANRRYFSFIAVALLALFMRGGILGTLSQTLAIPPQIAILVAIGAAALINYLGCAFWVFPQEGGVSAEHKWRALALGIVAYTVLLRLAYMGIAELLPEEAYYWNYAQHLDLSYLDHPPMVAWLTWLFTHIFGDTEFGIRIGALLCWIITGGFLFGFARNLFDKGVAFRAVLLLAVMPFFFGSGLLMTPDTPLVACWAGTLFFLDRAIIADRRLAWYGVGISLGLGMLSKYTIALLGPAILVFLLVDRRSRKWLHKPEPYMAAIMALLIFSPVLVWNYTHDWASFMFQGPNRWHGSFDFSLPSLVANILILLTPTGLAAAILLLLAGKKRPTAKRLSRLLENRRALFAVIFAILPLSVFVFFSLSREIKLNWTGPLWLVLLPFIAFYMKSQTGNRYQLALNKAWPGTILATLLLYGGFLHYLTLGFPGVHYPHDFRLIGWQDFSRQIDFVEDKLAMANKEKAVVIGMDKYNLASLMAFYRTKEGSTLEKNNHLKIDLTSGVNIFDENSLMYGFWADKKEMQGKKMILVSKNRVSLTTPEVLSHFRFLSPITTIPIEKNDMTVGEYFYRIADQYDPASSLPTKIASLDKIEFHL